MLAHMEVRVLESLGHMGSIQRRQSLQCPQRMKPRLGKVLSFASLESRGTADASCRSSSSRWAVCRCQPLVLSSN